MKNSAISSRHPAVSRRIILIFCLLLAACGSLGCGSMPNLEPAECTEARNAVKEFYSIHIGNEMKPSAENLKLRERFLSESLRAELSRQPETARDYFTQTEDYPKTFRVGGCEVVSPGKTNIEVLLFWKDETRSEQKEIQAEIVKENDRWLLNKISDQ